MSNSVATDLLHQVLTSPVTLEKLAAAGKFASVPLGLPNDVTNPHWTVLFEDDPCLKSVKEVYAPGDETGWAVVYKWRDDGMHTGETEVIYGRWKLVRGESDFSREPKSKSVFGLADEGEMQGPTGVAPDVD